jgi:anti-sigma-K factor RskA
VLSWLDARDARVQAALDRAALRDRLDPLLSPDLTMTTFRGQDAGVARVLAGADGRRWLVIAFDLPSVAGHDYQLWFVPEAGDPVSAGLLRPELLGVHDAVTTVPASLGRVRPAISLEPTGGSPSPTDIKLVGETI